MALHLHIVTFIKYRVVSQSQMHTGTLVSQTELRAVSQWNLEKF